MTLLILWSVGASTVFLMTAFEYEKAFRRVDLLDLVILALMALVAWPIYVLGCLRGTEDGPPKDEP